MESAFGESMGSGGNYINIVLSVLLYFVLLFNTRRLIPVNFNGRYARIAVISYILACQKHVFSFASHDMLPYPPVVAFVRVQSCSTPTSRGVRGKLSCVCFIWVTLLLQLKTCVS